MPLTRVSRADVQDPLKITIMFAFAHHCSNSLRCEDCLSLFTAGPAVEGDLYMVSVSLRVWRSAYE
jgi:hypothetical protein